MITFLAIFIAGFITGMLCTAFTAWQWAQESREDAFIQGVHQGRGLAIIEPIAKGAKR